MAAKKKSRDRSANTTSGERLVFARRSAGYESSAELHEALQKAGYRVTRAGVAHWEKNRNDISVDAAKAISQLTGIAAGWLLFNQGPVFLNDPVLRFTRQQRFSELRDQLGKANVTKQLKAAGYSQKEIDDLTNNPISMQYADAGADRIESALQLKRGELDVIGSQARKLPLDAWLARTFKVVDSLPESDREHALQLLESAARLVSNKSR